MKPYLFKLAFLLFAYNSLFSQINQNIQVFYLKDANSNFTTDSLAAKSKEFKVFENTKVSYQHEDKLLWLKILINSKDTVSKKKLLEVGHPFLEEVNLFIVKNGKEVYKSDTIGWKYPYQNRTFKHYNPVFPITIDSKASQTFYLRVFRRSLSFLPPIKVWNESDFYRNENSRNFNGGVFGGCLLIASFFGLILFLFLHERLYLLFSLYVLMATMYALVDNGFFFEYYPDGFLGFYKKNFRQFIMILNILFTMMYTKEYLFPKYKFKPTLLFFYRFCIFLCFLAVSFLWYEKYAGERNIKISTQAGLLYALTFLTPIVFSFYLVLYSYFKKIDVMASKFYIIGATPLVLFSILTNFRNYELISNYWFLETEGAKLAFIFDVIVLAIGLGYRYRILRVEREKLLNERAKLQEVALETGLQLQNKERSRLAKELHDGVGIDISIIKMKLEALGMDLKKKGFFIKEFEDTISNLDNVARDIRSFSHNLIPPDLENNSLDFVLHNLRDNVQKLNPRIEINFTTNQEGKLPSLLSQELFFIAKEMLYNALKHSKANIIDVELIISESLVELRIADNGQGYDFGFALKKGGLGLKSIISRVELLHGKFEIIQKPSGGVLHQVIVNLK